MATARIGISGWPYAPWRSAFHPPKAPQREEPDRRADRAPLVTDADRRIRREIEVRHEVSETPPFIDVMVRAPFDAHPLAAGLRVAP